MIAKLLSLSNNIFSYLQFHALLEEEKLTLPASHSFPSLHYFLLIKSGLIHIPYTVTVYFHSIFKDFIIKQLANLTSTTKNDR